MGKKNQDEILNQIQKAIVKIQDLKTKDPDDNPKFTEAIDTTERLLLEQLFKCVSQKFNKAKE